MSFRIVLIIIGALVLIALLVHGIWTVRKNNGQPKHRYYDESEQADNSLAPKSEGFDEYGIGEVRVVKQGDARASAKPLIAKAAKATNSTLTKSAITKPTTSQSIIDESEWQAELPFAEKAEPELNFTALDDEQAEATSINDIDYSEPSIEQEPTPASPEPSEVLILYVLLPETKEIKGDELLSVLLTLGFKYGDMDIFHRHLDSSGSGEVLFSLANMFNPGTFDLDNMEKLQTRGVSLFMTLPGPGDALQNFNLMHNAAKKLASEFSGQVLDGQRSVLTVQTVRHYVDKIREFQRQKLIHG